MTHVVTQETGHQTGKWTLHRGANEGVGPTNEDTGEHNQRHWVTVSTWGMKTQQNSPREWQK